MIVYDEAGKDLLGFDASNLYRNKAQARSTLDRIQRLTPSKALAAPSYPVFNAVGVPQTSDYPLVECLVCPFRLSTEGSDETQITRFALYDTLIINQ